MDDDEWNARNMKLHEPAAAKAKREADEKLAAENLAIFNAMKEIVDVMEDFSRRHGTTYRREGGRAVEGKHQSFSVSLVGAPLDKIKAVTAKSVPGHIRFDVDGTSLASVFRYDTSTRALKYNMPTGGPSPVENSMLPALKQWEDQFSEVLPIVLIRHLLLAWAEAA